MSAHALHDFFGRGFHKMDGLAIALNNAIFERPPSGDEAEDISVEVEGLFHVGNGQHRADFAGDV
jgi:hypothetical protein